MCINEVWHCVACRGFFAIKSTKPNLRTFWGFQKTSPFHWNLTESTFSPISGQIESRTIEKKNPCSKTCIEDKTNLTLLGIKWPTEVDMPLNKTQTQFFFPFNLFSLPFLLQGSPHGVVANLLDYKIIVSKFKLQSHYYIYFLTNTLGSAVNTPTASLLRGKTLPLNECPGYDIKPSGEI